MQTTSETILLITIWTLTGIGLFFGTKAKIRRRLNARKEAQQVVAKKQDSC
jgi:hypothetical protein